MKRMFRNLLAALVAFAALNFHSPSFAQGPLTPPGAPGPTLKTLEQVEPRTDVLKLAGTPTNLFVITQPGSYYLTTNVVGVAGRTGIRIASGNVTLDLNGFAVLGVAGSLKGINVSGSYTNITIRNGSVSGWGGDGVDAYSVGQPRNVVVERLTVSANGGSGITARDPSVVRDCLAQSNSVYGIYCNGGLVTRCVARYNKASGIYIESGVVSECQAQFNGNAGIFANTSSVVRDCQVQASAAQGIFASSSTVSGCFVQSSIYSGIFVGGAGSHLTGNTCKGNNTSGDADHAGIYLDEGNNRVENNHVTASGHAGIKVAAGYVNNIIIRNTVSGNTNELDDNYMVTGNNAIGPRISTFGNITSSNPWANFSY